MCSLICKIDSVNADKGLNIVKSRISNARILSVSTAESISLYSKFPNTVNGTRLSDTELTKTVGLRLNVVVADQCKCICGTSLDEFKKHALTYNSGLERF